MRFLCSFLLSFLLFAPTAFGASGDYTPTDDPSERLDGLSWDNSTPQITAQDWVDVLLTGNDPAEQPSGTGTDIKFNLFRDDTFFAQVKRHIPLGLNREASINYVDANSVDATHMDERDFLAAREVFIDPGLDDDSKYEHTLTGLQLNDEIKVMLYVHNNATHKCTSDTPLNTATNVQASLDWSDNVYTLVGDTTTINLVGNINADNETGMTAPAAGISDTVDLTLSGEVTLRTNSVTVLERIDPDGTPTGNECGSTEQGWQTYEPSGAALTSTDTSEDVNLGSVDGSYANVHIVVYRLEVVAVNRDFDILKTASPDPRTNTIEEGDTITYTIQVTNEGAEITNLELTDTLNPALDFVDSNPPGSAQISEAGGVVTLDFDTLSVDETDSLAFDVTVNNTAVDGSNVCNTASGFGDDGTGPPGVPTTGTFTSNSVCYSVSVSPSCGNNILELDKDEECDDGGTCVGGANDGNFCDEATDCTGGTCTTQSQDGCSATCKTEDPGLTISKSANVSDGSTIYQPDHPSRGGNPAGVNYTLTITNTGEQVLNNLVITDVIKDGLTVTSVQDSGGAVAHGSTPSGDDTEITINHASLGVGASVDYFIFTEVDLNAQESTVINQASVTGEAVDSLTGETTTLNRNSGTTNHNIPAKCGNSAVETGEQCDLGDILNGDGCDSTCQLETLDVSITKFADNPYSEATVGRGDTIEYRLVVKNNAGGAMTNVVITDTLNSNLQYQTPVGHPEISHSGEPNGGTVTVNVSGGLAAGQEKTYNFTVQVDPAATLGEVTNTVSVSADGTVVGQPSVATGGNTVRHFIVDSVTPVCGNGRLETGSPVEQCDDGNTTPGDGCSSVCLLETTCGNSTVETGEDCDDGDQIPNTSWCNDYCQTGEDCGNGIREGSEQADDGNLTPGDNVNEFCQIEVNEVTMTKTSLPYSGTTLTKGDEITYTISITNPEVIAVNSITITDDLDDELELVLPNADGFAVTDVPTNTISLSGISVAAGTTETYEFVARVRNDLTPSLPNSDALGAINNTATMTGTPDGQSSPINATSNSTIHFAVDNQVKECGNGRIDQGETCDDGDAIGTPGGCSGTCQFEGANCQNLTQTGAEGEECDDGNDTPGDGCNRVCQLEQDCGNGVVEGSEGCDDGNLLDGDYCTSECVVVPVCGDGLLEGLEECDDGNLIDGDGCSLDCHVEKPKIDGAGAPVRTVVGICDITPSLVPQCIGKRPERSDEFWDFYQDCKDEPGFTEEECAMQWAVHEGFQLCGDLAREFYAATPAEAMEYCGYEPLQPLKIDCQPSYCPDCIFGTSDISIAVRDPHEGGDVYKAEGVHIAEKEDVEYRVEVDLSLKDADNFQLRPDIPVRVNIYDYTVPSESAHVWYREGIINEDICEESQHGRECWVVRDTTAGGKIFSRSLTQEEVELLNAGATQTVRFDYEMKSDFLFEETLASELSNVVFATLEFGYDYYDTNLEVWSAETDAVYGVGGDMCSDPVYFPDLLGGQTTLGARSTITLQRPTLQAHGGESVGSQMLQTSLFGQEAGSEVTPGWVGAGDSVTGYYRNLIQNSINISGGVLFDQMIPETDTGIYYINSGDVKLIGNIDMRGTSKTFIIEGYNLEVLDDFEVTNGFVGFIVIGGDIVVSNHVRSMQGIFIAKAAERNRQMVGGNIRPELGVGKSGIPLQISGALIGNLEQLTANRVYIGQYAEDGDFDTQPSIESIFDVRMLEQTPPGLEATRGNDWGQGL